MDTARVKTTNMTFWIMFFVGADSMEKRQILQVLIVEFAKTVGYSYHKARNICLIYWATSGLPMNLEDFRELFEYNHQVRKN